MSETNVDITGGRIGGESTPATVPTLEQIYRDVASLALYLHDNAVGCRIVIDVPDGSGGLSKDRITVPLAFVDGDDMAKNILIVLGRLKAGEWMKGQSIANELDVDRESGNFRRMLSKLVREKKIESDNPKGYRLKRVT